ncbi:MAG: hypothetical protein HYV27_03465 [Candidatus Hydrogenedentes bacterium]|nr:hypothetical protein [Candidatus Hydrogenedentota bacterium]
MNSNHITQTFSKLFPAAGAPFTGALPSSGALFGDLLEYANLPQWLVALPWDTQFAFCAHPGAKVVLRAGADWDETVLRAASGGWSPESGVEPVASYWAFLLDELESQWPPEQRRGFDGLVHFPAEDAATSWPIQSLALVLSALSVAGIGVDTDISRRKLLQVIEDLGVGMPYWSQSHAACALLSEASCLLRAGGRSDQIDMLPMPEEWTIVAVPVRMTPVRKLGQLNECARFLVEQQVRAEFDPEFELESMADLWYGALCLRHGEVQEVVRQALAKPPFFQRLLKALDNNALGLQEEGARPLEHLLHYYLNTYRNVELAGDALVAGDHDALRGLYGENLQHRATLLEGLNLACPVNTELWRNLPVLGFSLSGCGAQQWLLGLVETGEEAEVMLHLEKSLTERGVLAGAGHAFRPHAAGAYGR